jgi:ABC-2 type transport system permease protein
MPTSDAVVAPEATPAAGPVARGAGPWRASVRLLRSELRLVLSRRRNQVGLAVLAAVPVVIAIAVKVAAPSSGGTGTDFIDQIAGNGFFVALAALSVEIGLFLPLAVAALAGDAIAGEANVGTLRGLLVVPVPRTRLLVVKYVSLIAGSLVAVVLVAVVGLVAGTALFGLHPVTTLSGTTIGLGPAFVRLLLVVAYVTAFLAALGAIGLFVSALTEQPMGATIGVVLISTTMWILDAITQLGWLHPWLLVHQQAAFADLLRDPVLWDNMRLGLLTDLAYAVVFASAAWARFATKDVTS